MGRVISINISQIRGTDKTQVNQVKIIEGWGLEGDAHGGNWDRQISIFPVEALEKVPLDKKEEVLSGGLTENLTIEGIAPEELRVGSKIMIGEAEIEILHIGKEEFKEHGRPYIVSREGRFGKVLKGGFVSIGDKVIINK
ncbi:MOSC domain-containing protein [Desulfotomaculum defluvii]